jgi:uncharacterized protein GlcG (DUF336 family)
MLSLSEATRVLAAAEDKAVSIGRPMNLCVTDEGGHLLAHIRMDGAWRGGIELATRKAYTACAFEMATKDLVNLARSGEDYAGMQGGNNHERFIIATGGVPLRRNGRIAGAIGVSGGLGNQDQLVAEAAARAFSNELSNGHKDLQQHDYQPVAFGQKVLSRQMEERQ